MTKQALLFHLQSYRIQATYYNPHNSREGSHPERLEFLCESPMSTFQAVLDSDTSFLYFDSLSHFFSYLRRNRKKKEIVEFDGRGYLSFHVESNQGYQGIQPINLIQSCRATQQTVRIERYTRDYEERKEILVETLKQAFRIYMRQKSRVAKMRRYHKMMSIKEEEAVGERPSVIFSLTQANQECIPNAQYHLSTTSPIFEFQVSITSLTHSPFKVRIQKMECQQLIVGIRYILSQSNQEIKHTFRKSNGQIDEGDETSVCWQDTSITINNHTKNRSKSFPKPHSTFQRCTVFLSLVPPK